MNNVEMLKLYNMSAMEILLDTDRHVIYKYIKAGLLKGRKSGHGWKCSGAEIAQFYKNTEGMDISNDEKIILAGQMLRNERLRGYS